MAAVSPGSGRCPSAEMPTVPFLQYLVLFSSYRTCDFFFFKDHFVYTSMETK